ncbi:hypothetical protein [Paracoccus homiensis]|uniref:Uncharacterized protein n=1 Tax=Paracoccus homiensis TaxID=364199 RepID=A0A1I0JII7_9RHOB|nr:hypothetical protein [Paracoccus homiensis]SEU09377.1 hypothetical protein SAMN04489858_1276 [Paracoccus homiensis]
MTRPFLKLTDHEAARRFHAHRASLRARRLNLRPPGGWPRPAA